MIYLVEDDNSIRELVVYTLQSTGFEARGFACGADFWEGMKEDMPELVLLDIMLPGMNASGRGWAFHFEKTAWNCSNSEASGDDADSEGNGI